MKLRSALLFLVVAAVLSVPSQALAAFGSGSTGFDGAFNPSTSTVVDLSIADTGPGTGHYDAARWTVIFNYTTINIPPGVTVTFKNHPSGAPVVWLASGEVTIAGRVDLTGGDGHVSGATYSEPGPGGFAGGRGMIAPSVSPGTAGFGPGGGQWNPTNSPGAGGGYGTPGGNDQESGGGGGGGTYGNEAVLPLIGGSGGAAASYPGGGGAGGGAILIAGSAGITISAQGSIVSNGGVIDGDSGGGGGGSGGAIRLIANQVSGGGLLRALGRVPRWSYGVGGVGGKGRIRVEAPDNYLTDPGDPNYSPSSTTGPIFPYASAPALFVSSLSTLSGSVPVTADPRAGIQTVDAIIPDSVVVPVTVHIGASNIPTGTVVSVYLGRDAGVRDSVLSAPLSGTLASSTTTATVLLSRGRQTEMFLRANWGLASAALSAPRVIKR